MTILIRFLLITYIFQGYFTMLPFHGGFAPKVTFSKEELQKRLTPEQWLTTSGTGLETAWLGKYNLHWKDGIYKCILCHEPLFNSKYKTEDREKPCFAKSSGKIWESLMREVKHTGRVADINIDEFNYTAKIQTMHVQNFYLRCENCGNLLGTKRDNGSNWYKYFHYHLLYTINSNSLIFEPWEYVNLDRLVIFYRKDVYSKIFN